MTEKRTIGTIAGLWGVIGVALLLGSAVCRLTPIAVEAVTSSLTRGQWSVLLLVLVLMAYAEGYRAFQLGFSPRVAARARYLKTHRNTLHAVLAPLFCMAYFHAPRKRRITALSVTAGIIVLIILVRLLPQPWRGIIDAGVVVGLVWGLVTLIVFGIRAFRAAPFDHSPEVPEQYEKL